MRMKKFTLLTLALFVMSVVAFAQPLQTYTYSFLRAMNGWTTIDADGDGNDWYLIKNSTILGHDGKVGMMTSASYNNAALNPDNYLVSPKMKLDGSITFYACAQDASWAAENFAVMVSTASGTNPSDFTKVGEWTMTASRSLAPRRAQGTWYEYTIDLSTYEGAEGYVAIRHFDCTDWFRLNVDDITLRTSQLIDAYDPDLEVALEDLRVTPPAELETEDWTIARYYFDGSNEEGEEKVLQVGFDGNDVYVQGFSHYSDYMEEDNWIKGTLSDDGKSITFASGQYYGNYSGTNDYYFAAYDLVNGGMAPSVTVAYDAEAGTMTWPEDILIIENASENEFAYYGFYTSIPAMLKGTAPDPIAAPDIDTSEWYFKSKSLGTDNETGEEIAEDYNLHVQVGMANNEVFVKGLCEDLPDAWIKGTLDPAPNKVTFPAGQHFGTYGYWFWTFEYFFAGYGENGQEDVVMNYDAEAKTLTMESPSHMLINAAWLLIDPNLVLTDVTLQEIPDVAATPAQPSITGERLTGTSYPNITVDIPDTDAEGNPLLIGKLSYQYYYEIDHEAEPLTLTTNLYTELGEDMTEIPYNFSDSWDIYNYRLYLNMDFSTWNRIGIQSIYHGGGEVTRSEIFWLSLANVNFISANDQTIASAMVDETDMTEMLTIYDKLRCVSEGSTVKIGAPKGYKFVKVEAKIDDENTVEVAIANNGSTASFTMPYVSVTVSYELAPLDIDDVIELLRQETELAMMLFRSFGDTKDEELLKEMFKAIGQANSLLKKYDSGQDVSLDDAQNLLELLQSFNNQFADVVTGITGVNQNENQNQYYDLQGRRVAQPTKGLYIQGGRKVLIK